MESETNTARTRGSHI